MCLNFPRREHMQERRRASTPATTAALAKISDSNLQRFQRCIAASGCSSGRLWFRELRGETAQRTGQGYGAGSMFFGVHVMS